MADLFCSFLDFRSLTANSNLHLFLPSKHYYSSALAHSLNSRINGVKRRPLHLTLPAKPSSETSSSSSSTCSSSNLDIISTHEYSDGSILFRFGDPSEVPKNVETEQFKTVKDEIESEGEDGYGVVKVLDGDHEKEVLVKEADRGVTASGLTEEADYTKSVVSSSESISMGEGDNGSSENLLEGSNDSELPVLASSEEVELPVLSSSEEVEVHSTPTVDMEHAANVEEDQNEEQEDSSPAFASIPDESAEMENNTSTIEEKETADVLQASLETVVTADDSADAEHQNMETEAQNKVTKDGKEIVESDLVSPSAQSEPVTNLSEEIEDQNSEAEKQNVIVDQKASESNTSDLVDFQHGIVANGNESEMNGTEAEAPPNKAALNQSKVAEAQAAKAGNGTPNEIVEYESGSDTIQLVTVLSQLEAESMLDEETGKENVGESREDDGAERIQVLNDMPQSIILESERIEVDENALRGDLVEESVHEVTELSSAESATESQEILKASFVLSSGAVLLPHPSKVLTGGEDAYFIAGQTWLGVADGVDQWSLEGTKPGVYARELIKNCERLVSDGNGSSVNNPVELLSLSVAETQSPGSSAALIAQFDGQALHVANIGDSAFIVLRHGAICKRSSPMLHVFHFPFQIESGDEPSSLAESYKVDLEEGDVIIIATDGLLDNLYDQDISKLVMNSLAADKKLEEIAEFLATKAQDTGKSATARIPFADDARAAGYTGYTGGKLDDVAVIVSVVKRHSNPQNLFS